HQQFRARRHWELDVTTESCQLELEDGIQAGDDFLGVDLVVFAWHDVLRLSALPRAQPRRFGELTVRQSRELALHDVHSREIASHIVVAALLARGRAEAAPGELVAGAGPAQVDDRGEVLLLPRRGRYDASALQRARDVSIEQRGGQLDSVTRKNARVQAPEPAVLTHHVVTHAV